MRRCRFCGQPLTTDVLRANTGEPPLNVHVRCAHDFMGAAVFAFYIAADDAGDRALAARWLDARDHLIALDPPRHVEVLLIRALHDDPEPAP